ncbi:hypothetical protein RN001_004214 [Aquatica leii]|uniref:Zinc transporter ZIP3 n=1 Tax=Aquatica leii TaxID=1421715 RepID=A0AAN7Q5L3_9COLE|nr:hypothetical protein RN001_004214 [Aquatica leii]
MELYNAKLLAALVLGVVTTIVGVLPGCFTLGRPRWKLFLSSLLCFGGGVLMSTSLIHILPEVRQEMPQYEKYAEVILCCGFFIVYIIDECVHFFYGNAHPHFSHTSETNNRVDKGYGSTDCESRLLHSTQETSSTIREVSSDDEPPSQLCHVGHQEPCKASPISNIGLLVALCVHSILEGLAIGLQKSSMEVMLLLGAVASHKLVVSFCLGVEIASTTHSFCRLFGFILMFSGGSVIGLFIGMGVNEIPSNLSTVLFPVLQGLAAGTLLYVTVSEVIPRERARWHQQHHHRIAGFCQLFAIMLGFGIMTILTLYLIPE